MVIIIPILQLRKPRHWRVKQLAQGDTPCEDRAVIELRQSDSSACGLNLYVLSMQQTILINSLINLSANIYRALPIHGHCAGCQGCNEESSRHSHCLAELMLNIHINQVITQTSIKWQLWQLLQRTGMPCYEHLQSGDGNCWKTKEDLPKALKMKPKTEGWELSRQGERKLIQGRGSVRGRKLVSISDWK